MVSFFSNKIVNIFINNNIISKNEKDIYIYGLEYITSTAILLLILIPIFILAGMFVEASTFLIVFITIRINAGGYHADSHLKCQVLFAIIFSLNMIIIKLITVYLSQYLIYFVLTISILSFIIIFCLAPIDHKNKPFIESEIISFRNRTRILCLFYQVLIILDIIISYNQKLLVSTTIAMSTVALSILYVWRGRRKDEKAYYLEK